MAPDIVFENYKEHRVTEEDSLEHLARAASIPWQQLAEFNWKTSEPKEVNECLHDLVGCRHKTRDGKNYYFTSKDQPGIINIPIVSPKYPLATGKTHVIEVIRPHQRCNIELETVDDLSHMVGNISLTLTRLEGGPAIQLKSDERGFATAAGVLTGHYKVTLANGQNAYFVSKRRKHKEHTPEDEYGLYEEAVLDTRQFSETVTQVVAMRIATKEQILERKLLHNVYRLHDVRIASKRRKQDPTSHPVKNLPAAVDNLALLAISDGAINSQILIGSLLPKFFATYSSTLNSRNYFVCIVRQTRERNTLCVYNSSGAAEECFDLAVTVNGAYGAYTIFEDSGGQLFADITKKSFGPSVEGQDKIFGLEELVIPEHRSRLSDLVNQHRPQKYVMYLMPELDVVLAMALYGNMAPLEDYGNQKGPNELIDERNQIICRLVSEIYNEYIKIYISLVKATLSVKLLRELGPPMSPFAPHMPGHSEAYRRNLCENLDFHQLKAWKAIAVHLNHLRDRKTARAPYISIASKWALKPPSSKGLLLQHPGAAPEPEALAGLEKADPKLAVHVPVSMEIETKWTIDMTDQETYLVSELPAKKYVAGLEVEAKLPWLKYLREELNLDVEYKVDVDDPNKREVTIKTGPLEFEVDDELKVKFAVRINQFIWVESQWDPEEAAFEGGLKIETEKLLDLLKEAPFAHQGPIKRLLEFLEKVLPEETSVHVGIVGLTETNAYRLITDAPGLFDQPSPEEFVEYPWPTLSAKEQIHLGNLGWTSCVWDLKSYEDAPLPASMKSSWEANEKQRTALYMLGFLDVKHYHEVIEHSRKHETGWKEAVAHRTCEPAKTPAKPAKED
jgi:hypothetical protein